MATIVTRAGKGSPLSTVELDANFTNLNTDKLEINAALGTPASVTLTNATGLPTAGLVDNAVTDAKLRDSAGLSVIGRGANSTGDPADIAAGTNKQVLRREGSTLAFGAVDLSSNQAVTGTLPVNQGGTGITSFGTGVATWLGTPSSANLAAAVTDETGTGALVFANSPTLVTPALGTPASGVVTNLTGTASININGTVGATTPATGAFTTLSASTSLSTPLVTNAGTLAFSATGANIVTASTNGVERLRITSAGNVGIGTSSPQAVTGANYSAAWRLFNVASADNAGIIAAASSGPARLHLSAGSTSSTPNNRNWFIASEDSSLKFQSANDALTATERMRINSDGNVGIGTTSPDAKLTVNGAASFAAGTALLPSIARSGDLNTGFWFPAADTIAASTAGSERFRIDSSGNVGIGTSSPHTKTVIALTPTVAATTVNETADFANQFVLGNAATSNTGDRLPLVFNLSSTTANGISAAIVGEREAINWNTALSFWTNSITSGPEGTDAIQEKMRITSAGNLGLGATTPVSLLEVQGGLTTTGAVVTLSSKETSTVANDVLGRVNFRAALDAAGGDAILTGASIVALAEGTFSSTSNATSLLFQTGSSEAATTKMTLNSAGNLGLGVTPSAFVSDRRALQLGGVVSYFMANAVNVVGANNFFNGSQNLYIGTGHATQYAQSAGAHIWAISPSGTAGNAITFTTAATLGADGNFIVGSTTNAASARITAAINTATANTAYIGLQNDSSGANDWAITMPSVNDLAIRNVSSSYNAIYIQNQGANADIGINGLSVGSGAGVVFIANATTMPSTNPTGGGILYVDAGALKYRGSSGTVTTLGAA